MLDEIRKDIMEKEIKENGVKRIKKSIEKGLPNGVKNELEQKYKNYDKNFKDFSIKMADITTNINMIKTALVTDAIYDRKEDLIELGNMLINEANKIIELGKEDSK